MRLFTLDAPRPNAAAAPYTYFLPAAERLSAVRPGDSEKLVFRPTAAGRKWEAERMWVDVRSVKGERLTRVLDNDPDDIPGLEAGDPVAFSPRHIVAIQFDPDRAEAPPADASREYWERCMVDEGVVKGELKVGYLYREDPDPASPDDEHPDSGWRIRGDMRQATDDEIDARNAVYIALGSVLNQDDSWPGLIDAPTGLAFRRDFETNTYVSVPRG